MGFGRLFSANYGLRPRHHTCGDCYWTGRGNRRNGAGLTLYQVVREMQFLLAVWTGACPACHRDMPTAIPT